MLPPDSPLAGAIRLSPAARQPPAPDRSRLRQRPTPPRRGRTGRSRTRPPCTRDSAARQRTTGRYRQTRPPSPGRSAAPWRRGHPGRYPLRAVRAQCPIPVRRGPRTTRVRDPAPGWRRPRPSRRSGLPWNKRLLGAPATKGRCCMDDERGRAGSLRPGSARGYPSKENSSAREYSSQETGGAGGAGCGALRPPASACTPPGTRYATYPARSLPAHASSAAAPCNSTETRDPTHDPSFHQNLTGRTVPARGL